MTEAGWLGCTEPEEMLEFLRERASDRKFRLFACACVRRVWHLLADPRSRQAIEVAERYADGRAAARELAEARNAALAVVKRGEPAAWAAYWAGSRNVAQCIDNVSAAAVDELARAATRAARASGHDQARAWTTTRTTAAGQQVHLLRDLFGNPFHPARLDSDLRAWNGGIIPGLARALYEEGRFEDLPVLGDALEEAGCTDEAVLDHCRRPAEHARGCWVVDWALGRE